MEVEMIKYIGLIALFVLVAGCGSEPGPTQIVYVPVVVTPTPTPAPTTLVGFWKVANSTGTNAWFNGYGIDITSHVNGEIRGRSIYPFDNVTGLLIGTMKSDGKVEWQTRYINGTESGSFQMEPTGLMRGAVYYELSTGKFSYTNVLLARQP